MKFLQIAALFLLSAELAQSLSLFFLMKGLNVVNSSYRWFAISEIDVERIQHRVLIRQLSLQGLSQSSCKFKMTKSKLKNKQKVQIFIRQNVQLYGFSYNDNSASQSGSQVKWCSQFNVEEQYRASYHVTFYRKQASVLQKIFQKFEHENLKYVCQNQAIKHQTQQTIYMAFRILPTFKLTDLPE